MRYLLITTLLIGIAIGLFIGIPFGVYVEAESNTKYVKSDGTWK